MSEEDILIKNEETQGNVKIREKAKELFEKHKKKIVIGGAVFILIGSNLINSQISWKKGYKEGYDEGNEDGFVKGIRTVMNNPSMLGKGLRDCRDNISKVGKEDD